MPYSAVNMRRTPSILVGVLVSALAWVAEAEAPPNVLFVLIDDLNCDIACYGVADVETPNIDALAGAGVRFDRAYSQGTACHPSRSSLLTGRTPLATGVFDNHVDYRDALPDAVTLARHFRNNGYVTAQAGKFAHRGYDDREAWEIAGTFRPKPASKPTTGPQRRARSNQMDRWGSTGPGSSEGQADYQVADKAIALLSQLKTQRFFLAVGLDGTHPPLMAPHSYHEAHKRDRNVVPTDFKPIVTVKGPAGRANPGLFYSRRAKQGEARRVILAYRAVTSFVDAQLGRILAELDRLGLRDNTLIVFASDHGFHLGEKGLWGKGTLFERGLRVPVIVAGPGVARGAVSGRPVQLLDLYPTLVDIAGLPEPGELDGHSLRPLLADPSAAWPHVARSWLQRKAIRGSSVRTERYRYTEWADGEAGRELYDHDADPRETTNLADDPAQAATVKRLSARLREVR